MDKKRAGFSRIPIEIRTEKCYDFLRKSKERNRISAEAKSVERSGTLYEMARDEARHGKALEGLLKRYFK